jgi:hypothetical protein
MNDTVASNPGFREDKGLAHDISVLSISHLFQESNEVALPILPGDGPAFICEVESLEKKTSELKHNLKTMIQKLNSFIEHRIGEVNCYSEMLESAKLLPHHGVDISENSEKLENAVKEANAILIAETRDLLIIPLKELLDETVRPMLDVHKKAFDAERDEYFSWQEKYLAMSSSSNHAQKKVEQDLKNTAKRRAYDQLRFVFSF